MVMLVHVFHEVEQGVLGHVDIWVNVRLDLYLKLCRIGLKEHLVSHNASIVDNYRRSCIFPEKCAKFGSACF